MLSSGRWFSTGADSKKTPHGASYIAWQLVMIAGLIYMPWLALPAPAHRRLRTIFRKARILPFVRIMGLLFACVCLLVRCGGAFSVTTIRQCFAQDV